VSYILDALRKSDAQRRRGAAPALHAAPAADAPASPRLLWWGLLAAALVGIGIVIGAIGPWQTNPAPPPGVAAAVPPRVEPASPPPAAAPAERAAAVPSEPVAKPGAAEPPVARARIKPAAPRRARKVQGGRPPAETARAASAPSPKLPAAEAAPEAPLVRFGELPVAVQEEIPKFKVAAHAYSSVPRNRLVSIDDRVLHEGDEVASGLKLEAITPNGMIMTYKGYRFLRSVR
jgi:general secretion pathway protein B